MNQIIIFIFLLIFNTDFSYSQYVPFTSGLSLENGCSKKMYSEMGYSIAFSKCYLNKNEDELKSKEVLFLIDEKVGYHFIGALSFKTSARATFEIFKWNDKLLNYNVGFDFVHYTNFSRSNNIICPKIGLIVFFGTLELSYGYNFIIDKSNNFAIEGSTIGLIIRPYLFLKSMKEMWS